MRRTLDTMAALGGVLYPLLVVSGLLLMGPALPPDFQAAPAQVADALAAHPPDALTAVGASLEFVGLAMLLLFAYRLTAWIGNDWTSRAAAALAAVGVTVKIASFAPAIVALWTSDALSPEMKATLFRLNDASVPVSAAAILCFTLLAGVLIIASARLPRWLGWFAVLGAPPAIADLFAGTGYLEIPSLLWTIAASIALAAAIRSGGPNHTRGETATNSTPTGALTPTG
jgi:hypothetical protein